MGGAILLAIAFTWLITGTAGLTRENWANLTNLTGSMAGRRLGEVIALVLLVAGSGMAASSLLLLHHARDRPRP